ncbi:unnamed protein product [Prorocentrum cordatum]|uniref:GDT1 family protein n=1 Tax=Prorocentrum cordatum TaxID=2364126 RepID=A0ABN9SS27_9DINO|nr:unnamed protein product [Polarella glacialis]
MAQFLAANATGVVSVDALPGAFTPLQAITNFDWQLDKNPTEALWSAFAMIMATELGGDETFIIAAVMSMRHPKFTVLAGALSALYFMTVLSAFLGVVLPNLISQATVHSCATVLYCFFGARLMWIGARGEEENKEEDDSRRLRTR